MFLKKKGFPEEGELVFATVTNVQYNSVFVKIENYDKQGLIHISEVSPGRIRNIRDFVKEDKMIVCKVLKIDKEKGHIDLSLRRVTEMQKRMKTDERKQEQKAEKIIEMLASEIKEKPEKIYVEVADILLPKYELLQYAFEDVVEHNNSLAKLGILAKYADKLEKLVKDKIKPAQVIISGTLNIKSYEEQGVTFVQKILLDVEQMIPKGSLKFLGAGAYSLEIITKDYKEAEKILKDILNTLDAYFKQNKNSEYSFKKKEKD